MTEYKTWDLVKVDASNLNQKSLKMKMWPGQAPKRVILKDEWRKVYTYESVHWNSMFSQGCDFYVELFDGESAGNIETQVSLDGTTRVMNVYKTDILQHKKGNLIDWQAWVPEIGDEIELLCDRDNNLTPCWNGFVLHRANRAYWEKFKVEKIYWEAQLCTSIKVTRSHSVLGFGLEYPIEFPGIGDPDYEQFGSYIRIPNTLQTIAQALGKEPRIQEERTQQTFHPNNTEKCTCGAWVLGFRGHDKGCNALR